MCAGSSLSVIYINEDGEIILRLKGQKKPTERRETLWNNAEVEMKFLHRWDVDKW